MNYVCLRIRNDLKIFRLRGKPGLPFWLFLYAQIYSLQQILFLNFLNWSWSSSLLFLSCYCCFLIWMNLLFLNWSLSLKIYLHHEKPGLPFWLFLYAQLYSWKRNLFLKYHLLMMTCLGLLIWSRNQNLNVRGNHHRSFLHENHLYRK